MSNLPQLNSSDAEANFNSSLSQAKLSKPKNLVIDESQFSRFFSYDLSELRNKAKHRAYKNYLNESSNELKNKKNQLPFKVFNKKCKV